MGVFDTKNRHFRSHLLQEYLDSKAAGRGWLCDCPDDSTSQFFHGCVKLIPPSAPSSDTWGLLHDTSLYFCSSWCPSAPLGNHCTAMINDTQAQLIIHIKPSSLGGPAVYLICCTPFLLRFVDRLRDGAPSASILFASHRPLRDFLSCTYHSAVCLQCFTLPPFRY